MEPDHGLSNEGAAPSDAATRLHVHDSVPAGRLPHAVAWLVAGVVALVACMVALGAIAEDVQAREANVLDIVANPFLHRLASPPLDAVMNAATFMASVPALPVLFVISVGVLLWLRRRSEAAFLVVALAGSFAINQALKLVFHRPRPQLAWAHVQPEYSFPSGHSQNGLGFYLAVALIVWVIAGRRPGVVAVAAALALSLLVGLSRVYFGYHYVTDVAGGYLAGLSWLLIVGTAFDAGPLLQDWRRRRDTAAPKLERRGPGPVARP